MFYFLYIFLIFVVFACRRTSITCDVLSGTLDDYFQSAGSQIARYDP